MTASTRRAVSPDSGRPWADEGAWEVAPGLHRIPLPLPMDGLRAVNVYVLSSDDGLVLIDGGWAIPESREVFERSMGLIGAGFADIRSFFVTHMHRDHYSMARTLGDEFGIPVALGAQERPGLDDLLGREEHTPPPFVAELLWCGADDVAEEWRRTFRPPQDSAAWWHHPDAWLTEGPVQAGDRTLDAVHTPGHTPGHYVFADRGAGLLFAGDHVLPTITPSLGFVHPVPRSPLAVFMRSLARVLALPDLRLLPAHGPLAPSSHARAQELLDHHEVRLDLCREALDGDALSAAEVAARLPWTRRERQYADLDPFNRALAALETRAHLEVLRARGLAGCADDADGVGRWSRTPTG